MAPLKNTSGRSFGKLLGVNRSLDLANDTNSGASKRGQLNSKYIGARSRGNEGLQICEATGGTTSTPGDGYKYHTYNSSSTFVVTTPGKIEYLLIGGGAGGGGHAGGGRGGAGGVRTNLSGHPLAAPDFIVSIGTYTVTIGSGGPGAPSSGDGPTGPGGNPGSKGGDTEFYLPTASYPGADFLRGAGGGGGGGGNPGPTTVPTTSLGGSGGGGSAFTPHDGGVTISDPNHPEAQGHNGGSGNPNSIAGGGGAGAGSNGFDAPGTPGEMAGGRGGYGIGLLLAQIGGPTMGPTLGNAGPPTGLGEGYPGGPSAVRWFAGGGGGGTHAGGSGTEGGGGGGQPSAENAWAGAGYGTPFGSTNQIHAEANQGGGGGGAGGKTGQYAAAGGNGGSGFVLIRYPA